MSLKRQKSGDIRILNKYPNRRIYDTVDSAYISFAGVRELVIADIPFKVIDMKTQEDVTRSVLINIISEEPDFAGNPFSEEMMKKIICLYGNSMQTLFSNHLEKSFKTFIDLYEKSIQQSSKIIDGSTSYTDPMSMSNPFVSNLMNSYMKQSEDFFKNLQQEFNKKLIH